MSNYYKPKYYFMWYRPVMMSISYFPIFFALCAMAHFSIEKRLKGFYLPLGLLILSIGSQLFLYQIFAHSRIHGDWLSCHSNLNNLGTSFIVCEDVAFDKDEEFKVPANWCEHLILYADISESSLYCHDSGARDGDSAYALNKNVIGKTLWDISANVVLLFESDLGKDSKKIKFQEREVYNKLPEEERQYYNFSHKVHKDQWNQIGGPEDIVIDRHFRKGCNILFADGHSHWVSLEDIPNLRWTIEEDN